MDNQYLMEVRRRVCATHDAIVPDFAQLRVGWNSMAITSVCLEAGSRITWRRDPAITQSLFEQRA